MKTDYDKKKFWRDEYGLLYMIMEKRAIPHFKGYFITTLGEVWSSPKKGSSKKGMWLKPFKNKQNNYLTVALRWKGKTFKKYIHQLVLETYVGKCPKGMECRHLDGNRINNNLGNLKWGTHSENIHDAIKHGTLVPKFYSVKVGSACHNAKLTEDNVREIISLYATGNFTQRSIAGMFSISPSTLNNLLHKRTWKHVWDNLTECV
jgi:hypothetical protein